MILRSSLWEMTVASYETGTCLQSNCSFVHFRQITSHFHPCPRDKGKGTKTEEKISLLMPIINKGTASLPIFCLNFCNSLYPICSHSPLSVESPFFVVAAFPILLLFTRYKLLSHENHSHKFRCSDSVHCHRNVITETSLRWFYILKREAR